MYSTGRAVSRHCGEADHNLQQLSNILRRWDNQFQEDDRGENPVQFFLCVRILQLHKSLSYAQLAVKNVILFSAFCLYHVFIFVCLDQIFLPLQQCLHIHLTSYHNHDLCQMFLVFIWQLLHWVILFLISCFVDPFFHFLYFLSAGSSAL